MLSLLVYVLHRRAQVLKEETQRKEGYFENSLSLGCFYIDAIHLNTTKAMYTPNTYGHLTNLTILFIVFCAWKN